MTILTIIIITLSLKPTQRLAGEGGRRAYLSLVRCASPEEAQQRAAEAKAARVAAVHAAAGFSRVFELMRECGKVRCLELTV